MIISLGHDYFNPGEEVLWSSEENINGHILAVGSSGTGKSHLLRHILAYLSLDSEIKVHVFDTQSDLYTDPDATSEVKFSEVSPFGINPFQINADPDFGGVRKRVNSFLAMLNRSSKIGPQQEHCLRTLLYDLYANFGFEHARPNTWMSSNGKRFPTMLDLKLFAEEKYKQLTFGSSNEAVEAINKLSGQMMKLNKKLKSVNDEEEIEKMKGQVKKLFSACIDNIDTGRELEIYMKYDSKDVLKSTMNRIDNLISTGLFKDNPPLFSRSKPIKKYNIESLADSEAVFLVDLCLEKIFHLARNQGVSNSIHTYIVLDESQQFTRLKDNEHILNRLFAQGRKFGISLVLATQSWKSFSEEMIQNAACKIITGVDKLHYDDFGRKFGVPAKRLAALTPKKTGLVQIRKSGGNSNYQSVIFS